MDHARGGQHGPGGPPWLIKKFIDPQAEFLFVPKDQVLEVARWEGGKSFDCPGADYTHREGKCSFEVLVEEYRLQDPALQILARIVHGADITTDVGIVPEAAGLQAIAQASPPSARTTTGSSSWSSPSMTPFTPGARPKSRGDRSEPLAVDIAVGTFQRYQIIKA